MSGISKQNEIVSLKLLSLILEVQNPVSELRQQLLLRYPDIVFDRIALTSLTQEEKSLIDLLDYCERVADLCEEEILGPPVHSSNIKFQSLIVSHIVSSDTGVALRLQNNLSDIGPYKVRAELLGVVLYHLILIITIYSRNDTLTLHSQCDGDKLIISITGVEAETFKNLGEELLQKSLDVLERGWLANRRLKICYNLLSRYGGNLWSESPGEEGGKVFFCMPVLKTFD